MHENIFFFLQSIVKLTLKEGTVQGGVAVLYNVQVKVLGETSLP